MRAAESRYRFIAGAPKGKNFEIVREVVTEAAYAVPVFTVFAGPNESGKSTAAVTSLKAASGEDTTEASLIT